MKARKSTCENIDDT